MKVKGTVTKSIQQYVKSSHPDRYNQWEASLSKKSNTIFQNSISVSEWYPIDEALIEPCQTTAKLFFKDEHSAAWELGRYSAEIGLKGVYKVFVMMSSPHFLIDRSSRIISMLYENAEISVAEKKDKSCVIHLTKLPINSIILEYRIGGWIEKALEICGSKNIEIDMPQRLSKGNDLTQINISWD